MQPFKTTQRILEKIIITTFVVLLLGSCFVVDKSLFRGIITAKRIWVEALGVMTIGFVGVKLVLVKKIELSIADIVIAVFCIWMISRELFSQMPYAYPQKYMFTIGIYYGIYLFLRSINYSQRIVKTIIVIYLLIVTAQAIIGLLQLYGLLSSYHSLFKITGTFHNPGPFSGFIVSGLPMALGLYFGTRRKVKGERNREKDEQGVESNQLSVSSRQLEVESYKSSVIGDQCSVFSRWIRDNSNKILNNFSQFVIVVLLLVLPAARSRAAWLGGIISCIYVLYYYRKTLRIFVLPSWFSALQKKYVVLLLTLLFLVSLVGLYKFKKGSADGRLLIWQVSLEMIKDKPLLGWGQGGFDANYANYQAEWFKSGKGTPEQEMVAGMPESPFNELIRVGISYGIPGAVLVLILLLKFLVLSLKFQVTDKKNRFETLSLKPEIIILKASLLSIFIFSLFSYSFDVAAIIVQMIIVLALITNYLPCIFYLNLKPNSLILMPKLTVIILLILLSFSIQNISKKFVGLKHWQEAYRLYKCELYSDAAEEYLKANKSLPKNGLLKQMYGKCLVLDKKWEDAKMLLQDALLKRTDPIIYHTLGDVCNELGDMEIAEFSYVQAGFIEPHKFYPQYLLVKLYLKKGQRKDAINTYNLLLNKKTKVSSIAIDEMKNELKQILGK